MNTHRFALISPFLQPTAILHLLVWSGLFLMLTVPVLAQSACDEALDIAKREYNQGFFDEASFRLYACLGQEAFDAVQEKEAYLLLGKIHYANLDMEKARDSVRTLLMRDPALELNPNEYKPGFVDLVQEVMAELDQKAAPVPSPVPPAVTAPDAVRSGFWMLVSLGAAEGSIDCNCPLPEGDVWRGGSSGSVSIAGGGTVGPNLQLGAEISTWRRVDGNRSSTISMLSAVIKYYPGTNGQFFLKGGLGVGGARLEATGQNNVSFELQSGGIGVQFGLGYDFVVGISRKIAITPTINLSAIGAEAESFVFDDTRFGGAKNPSFFQIGVGVTVL